MPFCLNLNFNLLSLIHSAHSKSHSHTDADAPPPSKRRRTLAGSIASTALSAALIGTAVGITVYRLISSWRDRGKQHPQSSQAESQPLSPPPAYEQGEWVPPPHNAQQQQQQKAVPATPRSIRRTRNANTPSKRAMRHGHRKTRSHPHQRPQDMIVGSAPAVRPEFDFGAPGVEHEGEPEDQMDWIGTKLSQLIHEGQKALGREVVVASEAQEDEVDDGDVDGWVEEYPDHDYNIVRSAKRSRRHGHGHGHSRSRSSVSLSASASASHHQPSSSAPMSIPGARRAPGLTPSVCASVREDESAWMSPELRELMERARARYVR